ncbi:hypothetical protein EVAR_49576_1 [Eumeta japonica]|uniref:Uncharacterized protein n=1 Tax=Eumeta variegata TaxID=151549 RepID=A0A4C1YRP5_EUMVA|nr:hypothetical protein EVAR_49576_1 [Eumeta japonica]
MRRKKREIFIASESERKATSFIGTWKKSEYCTLTGPPSDVDYKEILVEFQVSVPEAEIGIRIGTDNFSSPRGGADRYWCDFCYEFRWKVFIANGSPPQYVDRASNPGLLHGAVGGGPSSVFKQASHQRVDRWSMQLMDTRNARDVISALSTPRKEIGYLVD